MGCLESGFKDPLKRHQFLQRPPRSKFSRFLLFKKLDYLQWICAVATFLFFVVLFQMFLPGYVIYKSEKPMEDVDLRSISGFDFDFGEDFRFDALRVLMKFQNEEAAPRFVNLSSGLNGYRKPYLALVFADLVADPQQLLMVTVATALREIGYEIKVYSLEDGPVGEIWQNLGVSVTILRNELGRETMVDWLNFDGILVNSFEAKSVFSRLMQEPFRSLPLVWTIHDGSLAIRSNEYSSTGQTELVNDWKKIFGRASVVVFSNYFLPMIYSMFNVRNYHVIPGSPAEAWRPDTAKALYKKDLHVEFDYNPDSIIISIVGSQFFYKGLWLEHALVLQALLPLYRHLSARLKIIVLSRGSTSNYSMAVETIALNLSYPRNAVKHVAVDRDVDEILGISDLVIYGSFLEEQTFPEILKKAMSFGKAIIAPDLSNIKKYVDDRVNGYLFPKENIKTLSQITLGVFSKGNLSSVARNIASVGRSSIKNMMVQETVEGYVLLLERVLKLSSEVALPKAIKELPPKMKEEWQWHLFKDFLNSTYEDRSLRSRRYLTKVEEMWNRTAGENARSSLDIDNFFSYEIWVEERRIHMANTKKRREEEELKDRIDEPRGTWEEVYRSAKKADRAKNALHERDEGELERTGQPLCIYEPYFGEGTWPFLHQRSLYRGIGLSTKGRRPGTDDIDAPSRLTRLNNPYYRDILGEHGAFFALANRIDRVHRNAWIGFQSWRATARNVSLSKAAENSLLDAIQTQRHGDSLYFWVRMDKDPRYSPKQDFWSFCDAINARNCKFVFRETLKRMYGVKHLDSLPQMPENAGTFSVMHSWALPTRSFLEFVMFSRMFVDALDAQIYDEHHQSGRCSLSTHKDKHCYSRLLELLVNIWAYHSGRHMVYINPETGTMQEEYKLKSRKGKMWIKWFQLATLKSMDEDLAEKADSEQPTERWLWPSTGEVVWQGVLETERHRRGQEKEKKKQQNKDRLLRMKDRNSRQKVLGKYVKSKSEISNSTVIAA